MLNKKMTVDRWTRYKLTLDDSRLYYCNLKYQVISVSSECIKQVPHFFNITSFGKINDLRNVSAIHKEKIRRDVIIKVINKWFYSTTQVYKSIVIMAQGNPAVNYPNWSFPNVLVAGVYYHLKYLDFQKGPDGNNNIGWFPRRLYIYKKRITEIHH